MNFPGGSGLGLVIEVTRIQLQNIQSVPRRRRVQSCSAVRRWRLERDVSLNGTLRAEEWIGGGDSALNERVCGRDCGDESGEKLGAARMLMVSIRNGIE